MGILKEKFTLTAVRFTLDESKWNCLTFKHLSKYQKTLEGSEAL